MSSYVSRDRFQDGIIKGKGCKPVWEKQMRHSWDLTLEIQGFSGLKWSLRGNAVGFCLLYYLSQTDSKGNLANKDID